jgi:hypothetical protein
VNEFPAYGIGPHDLRLLSDGRTLVVANGGILTHPDSGRAKLNLATMSPSLTYIDSQSGALLEEQKLPDKWHQNSIRHLGLSTDDTVCFIMQYQGSRRHRPPLVGLHRRGEAIKLGTAPEAVQAQMKNYCGSAVADNTGRWFAVSSPRGNLITFWDADTAEFAGHFEVADGCGIACGEQPGEYLFSSGQGDVVRYQMGVGKVETLPLAGLGARWDNHMASLTR